MNIQTVQDLRTCVDSESPDKIFELQKLYELDKPAPLHILIKATKVPVHLEVDPLLLVYKTNGVVKFKEHINSFIEGDDKLDTSPSVPAWQNLKLGTFKLYKRHNSVKYGYVCAFPEWALYHDDVEQLLKRLNRIPKYFNAYTMSRLMDIYEREYKRDLKHFCYALEPYRDFEYNHVPQRSVEEYLVKFHGALPNIADYYRTLNRLSSNTNIGVFTRHCIHMLALAMKTEYNNGLAKDTDDKQLRVQFYDVKHNIIKLMVDYLKNLGLEKVKRCNMNYGYHYSDVGKTQKIFYLHIPKTGQLSWHCDIEDKIIFYNGKWDEKPNSMWDKIMSGAEDYINTYGHLLRQ